MEIKGKIIVAYEPKGGVSQKTGNSWKTQEFVIETMGQYPKRCIFSVFGEERLQNFNLKVGDIVNVHLDIDAREYNGRYYNDVKAWKVERDQMQPQSPSPQVAQQPSQQSDNGDLPF